MDPAVAWFLFLATGIGGIFAPILATATAVHRILSYYRQGIADAEAYHHLAMDAIRQGYAGAAGIYLGKIREIDSQIQHPVRRVFRIAALCLASLAGYFLSLCLLGIEDTFHAIATPPVDELVRQKLREDWWFWFALYTFGSGYTAYLLWFKAYPLWTTPERIAEVEAAIKFQSGRGAESKSRKTGETKKKKPRAKARTTRTKVKAPATVRSNREILGLGLAFSRKELNGARRKLAKALHPDRWTRGTKAERAVAEDAMKTVNAAYDELKDEAK